MTAAAADLTRIEDANNPQKIALRIKDAAQVYVKAYGAIDTGTGLAKAYTGAAGEIPVGRIGPGNNYGTGLGDTSADHPPEAELALESHIRRRVAVTGASAATDQGSLVFLADDQTFTLTRPARGIPAGMIVKWHSSTTCDVLVFGAKELLLASLAGNGAQLVCLGRFDATKVTDADLIKATIPSRYRLRSVYAVVEEALAGGTSIVVTFKKDSTAFNTGGVLSLATNAAAAKVSASAITQDSGTIFSESHTLTGSFDVTGTYTAGTFNVFALIDLVPGV